MKRYIRAVLCALVVTLLAVGVSSAAGKIGVVDIAVVIDESVAGQEANALLGAFVAERQQVVVEKEAELEQLTLSLEENGEGMSAEARAALQAQIDAATTELTQLLHTFEAEINAAIEELRGQILSDIEVVLQIFGVENEFGLIFDAASAVFVNDTADVTWDVIGKYDELLAESRAESD